MSSAAVNTGPSPHLALSFTSKFLPSFCSALHSFCLFPVVPSCPQASHLAPQAKVGPGGPKPPFLRGGHPASTGTGRGCVHSPEPPSTSAHCPVLSSQGPRLHPAPRACQWPPLSTPGLVHTSTYPSCVPSALLSTGHSDRLKGGHTNLGRCRVQD